MSRRVDLARAADDMRRVLDVVDAMHADSPEYAALLIESMGMERTAEAALRLLDVVVHVVIEPQPGGARITAEDLTEYLRGVVGHE